MIISHSLVIEISLLIWNLQEYAYCIKTLDPVYFVPIKIA
jgi:hypothetical protein